MVCRNDEKKNGVNGRQARGSNGLYDPAYEHDACGLGFVAHMKNKKSHDIVQKGLSILKNLEHRGAVGADPKAGDGCGILIQMPDEFCQGVAKDLDMNLPLEGDYAVMQLFLPQDKEQHQIYLELIENEIRGSGFEFLGWRHVPVDNSDLGYSILPTEPYHMQAFVGRNDLCEKGQPFELKLFLLRRKIALLVREKKPAGADDFYIVSFSAQTLLYKGMLLSYQLSEYYLDLMDERMKSALAMVHQRFSTNTFPSWKLAHPFRMISHNGEINTIRGNVNWMAARQSTAHSKVIGEDLDGLWPLIPEGQSDTACFDNALELLVCSGYTLPHAMMMLIPEAWAGNPLMDAKRRAFYEYNAALMEPWDGPAAVTFTDGKMIGATLDRNGLRPARYYVTNDDMIMLASEMGVLPAPEETIVTKWRLQPGKMLLVDLEKGRIISDDELKDELANSHPYQEWLEAGQIRLSDLPEADELKEVVEEDQLLDLQQTFGYTQESAKYYIEPMVMQGQDPIGSMGTDTPLSSLSVRPKLMHTYFKQNFAQVTNPPIDPIREELVMSLVSFIGPRPNLLDLEGTSGEKRLEVAQPILRNGELRKIREIGEIQDNHFKTITQDITWSAQDGAKGMGPAILQLCKDAEREVQDGYNIIILSDRQTSADRIPIPSLLATSAVHHHLIRAGLRTSVGLVVETGEAHEVHQFCTLAGYGAEAINPWLAFATIKDMLPDLDPDLTHAQAVKKYIKAINKGMLKVMSKMGISTYQSYCGAQIFDAVGLKSDFVKDYFTGTFTQVEGVGLEEIARETVERHRVAFSDAPIYRNMLDVGGEYAFRLRGERHSWTPSTIGDLQHAVRSEKGSEGAQAKYDAFAAAINNQNENLMTFRGLMRIKSADELGRSPVPLEEVEPASELVKRFATGAMSFGSISREAHSNLAIAMNRLQAKSNTGEGGEEPGPFPAHGQWRQHALGHQAGGVGPLWRDHRISRQCRHDPDQDHSGRQAWRRRGNCRDIKSMK